MTKVTCEWISGDPFSIIFSFTLRKHRNPPLFRGKIQNCLMPFYAEYPLFLHPQCNKVFCVFSYTLTRFSLLQSNDKYIMAEPIIFRFLQKKRGNHKSPLFPRIFLEFSAASTMSSSG